MPFCLDNTIFSSGGNTFKISLYTTNPYTTASTVIRNCNNGEVDTTGGTNYSVKTLTSLGVASEQQSLQLTLIHVVIVVHLSLQLLQLSTIQIQLIVANSSSGFRFWW